MYEFPRNKRGSRIWIIMKQNVCDSAIITILVAYTTAAEAAAAAVAAAYDGETFREVSLFSKPVGEESAMG